MEIVNPRHRTVVQPQARQASTFARCVPSQEVTQFARWSASRVRAPRKRPPTNGYDATVNEQYGPKAA